MADTLPLNLPIVTSPAIASYDFTELATGLGFETFYAHGTKETTSAVTYQLTPFSTIIWPNQVSKAVTTGGAQASATVDFDTSAFNLPRTAKGTAVVNFVWQGDAASSCNAYISAQILKVASGGGTTAITSAKVRSRDTGTGGESALAAGEEENVLLFLPITQTTIGVGEKLRLEIILTVVDFPRTVAYYFDPQGRNSVSNSDVSTQLKLLMPFRIN